MLFFLNRESLLISLNSYFDIFLQSIQTISPFACPLIGFRFKYYYFCFLKLRNKSETRHLFFLSDEPPGSSIDLHLGGQTCRFNLNWRIKHLSSRWKGPKLDVEIKSSRWRILQFWFQVFTKIYVIYI